MIDNIKIDEVAMLLNASHRARLSGRRSLRSLTGLALLICVLALVAPGQVFGQAKGGTTGAQFLELGVSARAMGMADAFTAVANDISAVYYNPAGLTSLWGREAMTTYVQMPAGINYGFAAFGMPLESVGGVVGFAMYGLSTGDIVERTYEQGTGPGTGRTFRADDYAISASYGRYLTDRFSIGLSLKYIGEYYHDQSASGWSVDVGTSYDTGYRGFKIAMVITNFGPDLKMIQKEYPLPINFKFGGVMNVLGDEGAEHLVTMAAEGGHPSDNLEKYNFGVEYTYKEMFILRSGHRFNYDIDGLTAGGGLRVPFGEDSELRVDYAYQDFGILTQVHRFSMSMAF